MGTKKGQQRKTARRAYEPKKKSWANRVLDEYERLIKEDKMTPYARKRSGIDFLKIAKINVRRREK